jgi:mannose-6-phosphate isomerase-like protein (cupin superfamily)
MPNDLSALLRCLADLYASDPSPAGLECARALRDAGDRAPVLETSRPHPLARDLDAVATRGPLPQLRPFRDLLPFLDWQHAGLENGRIRAEISIRMLTVELIGPDGLVFDPALRAGLFYQGPHLDYATRRHAAEESFVTLAGEALWSLGGGPLELRAAGELIHHPSLTPHRTVTSELGLLAAWRWSGEIGWDGYEMTG